MKVAIFDIETGPRSDAELASVMPEFKAPANYKDPEKIAAAIAEQAAEWKEKAALSAVTGRVVAIGWWIDGASLIIDCSGDNEAAGLRTFWGHVEDAVRARRILVGFNSNRFDIPFLTRRSWLLGVPVPSGLYGARGYVNQQCFIDLADEWKCGDSQATIKLDTLAKFFGVGGKNGDGAAFAGLWETDRDAAVAYLVNDLAMTAAVAERILGVDAGKPTTAGTLPHDDAAAPNERLDGVAPEYNERNRDAAAEPAPGRDADGKVDGWTPLSEETKAKLQAEIAAKKAPRKPRAPRETAPSTPISPENSARIAAAVAAKQAPQPAPPAEPLVLSNDY